LASLSVAVKDMYDIAGERVSGGNPAWLSAHQPAVENAAVVDQILAAGGTITGKTVCDEFFYSITGTNFHYGTPTNPRAPTRIPGGSSSGSASACSAGACDIAIGSDTGGSVRVPAALCGIYGIRTSHGRMDLRGAMQMAPSFDAGGWFASSPGVFSLAGPVLLKGWDAEATDVFRISLVSDAFDISDPAVAELCKVFLTSVSRQLPTTNAIALGEGNFDKWREAFRLKQAHEVWQSFGNFISRHDVKFGPGVGERMKIAASVGSSQVKQSEPVLAELTSIMDSATANRTVLVLPTCPSIAPLLTASQDDLERFRVKTMRLVCMASVSGLPQITMPIGTVDGAPVGLSFIGWRNGDEALLHLANRLAAFVGFSDGRNE